MSISVRIIFNHECLNVKIFHFEVYRVLLFTEISIVVVTLQTLVSPATNHQLGFYVTHTDKCRHFHAQQSESIAKLLTSITRILPTLVLPTYLIHDYNNDADSQQTKLDKTHSPQLRR